MTNAELAERLREYCDGRDRNPAMGADWTALIRDAAAALEAREGMARDALRYREVKACDWIDLHIANQEFVGVTNLDAWADARLAAAPAAPSGRTE